LTPNAGFDHLLRLPEGADQDKAVNEAMRDIEKTNEQRAGVLPKTYQLFESTLLKNLLKNVSEIPAATEGDSFGPVYEYFLCEFARMEGSRGGEFYTPRGRFDFVLANPPFNVNAVDKERLEGDVGKGRRFPFGVPRKPAAQGSSL
jgi:type I restriction-modification system DNA methylase subunit